MSAYPPPEGPPGSYPPPQPGGYPPAQPGGYPPAQPDGYPAPQQPYPAQQQPYTPAAPQPASPAFQQPGYPQPGYPQPDYPQPGGGAQPTSQMPAYAEQSGSLPVAPAFRAPGEKPPADPSPVVEAPVAEPAAQPQRKLVGWLPMALGVLLTALGALWTLQGLDVIEGSQMSGVDIWSIIGPIIGIVGLGLVVFGVKTRTRSKRKAS